MVLRKTTFGYIGYRVSTGASLIANTKKLVPSFCLPPLPPKSMSASPQEKKEARAKFEAVFPVIADEILDYMKAEGMPAEALEWMKNVGPLLSLVLWALVDSLSVGRRSLGPLAFSAEPLLQHSRRKT